MSTRTNNLLQRSYPATAVLPTFGQRALWRHNFLLKRSQYATTPFTRHFLSAVCPHTKRIKPSASVRT